MTGRPLQDGIKTMVVGCGGIGMLYDPASPDPRHVPQSHALAISRNPRFVLCGLVDPDSARQAEARARYPDVVVATDLSELQGMVPDLVVVATPSALRLAVVEQALALGARHIFCEKPLALTGAEAETILGICRSANVGLTVNFSRRLNKSLADVAKSLSGLELGRVQVAQGTYRGALSNNGAHLLDLATWLLGPLSLRAKIDRTTILDAPHEVTLTLNQLDDDGMDIFELDILCTRGRVRMIDGARSIERTRVREIRIGDADYIVAHEPIIESTDADNLMSLAYEDLAGRAFDGWTESEALVAARQVSGLFDDAASVGTA